MFVALAPNEISDVELNKWLRGLNRNNKTTIVVRPHKLLDLIKAGAVLMFQEWRRVIRNAQSDKTVERGHISGTERVYKKIMKEGAVKFGV